LALSASRVGPFPGRSSKRGGTRLHADSSRPVLRDEELHVSRLLSIGDDERTCPNLRADVVAASIVRVMARLRP
jgi:hypothetical protein